MPDVIKVATYSRISRDEDKKNYSTIESQKEASKLFCSEKYNVDIIESYEDDNVSGYTMDRPDFKRLINDVDENIINTIIVKDLSRIGRHNAYVLVFLDEMKKKNVRIVAITDNYDSFESDDDIIGIKTWYNEMYIKDISKKIKSNLKTKMRNNNYLCAVPFGYKINDITKKVDVDNDCKDTVKRIFQLYLDGQGYRKIGVILNEENIPTPSMMIEKSRNEIGKVYKKDVTQRWDATMIMRLLRNDFYIGTLRLGKHNRKIINGKSEKTTEDEQFIFENNHEPLVSKEDFELVQQTIINRTTHSYRGVGHKHKNLFAGFMFCSDCGSYMAALNKEGKKKSYICGTYNRVGRSGCTTHYILDDKIKSKLIHYLENVTANHEKRLDELNKNIQNKKKYSDNMVNKLDKLQKENKQINDELKVLISQKIKDIAKSPDFAEVISTNYDEIEREKRTKLQKLNLQINELEKLVSDSAHYEERLKTVVGVLREIINKDEFEKKDLETLLEKIIVYQNGELDIFLKPNVLF